MTRVSTGIVGLDEMLGGGFISNRIILVRGGPGSGKTIFSLQFIVDGVKKGERGIYVTLEEPLNLIKANMTSFGWDLEDFEKKGALKMIDGSQLAYKPSSNTGYSNSSPRLVMTYLANQIKHAVENFKAKRLAVDPITSAVIQQRFPTDKRLEILELVKTLRGMQCTSIITSEFSSPSAEGEFYVEEYLADGVIILSKTLHDFKVTKTVRIEKMRGIKHDDQPRRCEIGSNGLVVYHTEPVTT
jgi:KaiC/GvpD/RAD55 family RecA-like ATPase